MGTQSFPSHLITDFGAVSAAEYFSLKARAASASMSMTIARASSSAEGPVGAEGVCRWVCEGSTGIGGDDVEATPGDATAKLWNDGVHPISFKSPELQSTLSSLSFSVQSSSCLAGRPSERQGGTSSGEGVGGAPAEVTNSVGSEVRIPSSRWSTGHDPGVLAPRGLLHEELFSLVLAASAQLPGTCGLTAGELATPALSLWPMAPPTSIPKCGGGCGGGVCDDRHARSCMVTTG
mmetsp:Transcript_124559/g.195183  ORF Transcript_124559/g.195183 Transcript_124559/m.195183 type:complete len:235 (-) Transcript_124559:776-1480(-)